MIIFDTNLISEMMSENCDARVAAWLKQTDANAIATTAVTAAELLGGIALRDDGKKKSDLHSKIEKFLQTAFEQRVYPFDLESSRLFASIVNDMRKRGRAIGFADCQIAAICLRHNAHIATRDINPFRDAGVAVIDPWNA